MAEILNNVNLELHEASSKKARENNNSLPATKTLSGEFNLSGSPMFSAELGSSATKFVFGADEPGSLGGRGVQPTPLTYILFGAIAGFATSLAGECAEEGLELKDLKVRGTLSYDLGPAVTDAKAPLIKGLKLEVVSGSDLSGQIKKAWEKCPAVYALQNPVPTEIEQSGK